MLSLRSLLGVVVFCVLVGSSYYLLKPTPKLSFSTYKDLSAKNIDQERLKRVTSIHASCFHEPRAKNYLDFVKKKAGLGKSELMIEAMVKEQIEKINLTVERTFNETTNMTFLQEGDEIVGIYSCQDDHEDFEGATMIWNLCVAPEARGKGYGKKLTEHAIKRCSRKGADLGLVVYKDNLKAKKIYEKQGFVVVPWDYDADNNFDYYNKYLMKYKVKAPQKRN